MARRLLEHSGELAIFDARSEAMVPLADAGAVTCCSPVEVADRAATVFLSLPSPDTVRAVVLGEGGLLAGRAIRTFVDLSTTGPAMAGEIVRGLLGSEIAYVDAPVSGGPSGACAGRLTVMFAGSSDAFLEVAPLLRVLSTNVLRVGEVPGQGQLAKLLNNLLSASAIVITAEAVVL